MTVNLKKGFNGLKTGLALSAASFLPGTVEAQTSETTAPANQQQAAQQFTIKAQDGRTINSNAGRVLAARVSRHGIMITVYGDNDSLYQEVREAAERVKERHPDMPIKGIFRIRGDFTNGQDVVTVWRATDEFYAAHGSKHHPGPIVRIDEHSKPLGKIAVDGDFGLFNVLHGCMTMAHEDYDRIIAEHKAEQKKQTAEHSPE